MIFFSSISFKTNGWENSNVHNFLPYLHKNPPLFYKSLRLYGYYTPFLISKQDLGFVLVESNGQIFQCQYLFQKYLIHFDVFWYVFSYCSVERISCHNRDTCGVYRQCEFYDGGRERLARTQISSQLGWKILNPHLWCWWD